MSLNILLSTEGEITTVTTNAITSILIIIILLVLYIKYHYCDNEDCSDGDDDIATAYNQSKNNMTTMIGHMQNAGIPDDDIRGFVQDVITAHSILDTMQDGEPEEDYEGLTIDDNMAVMPEIGDISADN